MSRAGKRKHSSVAPVDIGPFSAVTETPIKRRRQSPGTGSTKNVKKDGSGRDRRKLWQRAAQDQSTSRGQPPRGNTSVGYQCPICLEGARNNEMDCLPCYHAFHQTCINQWLTENRRCPVCRQETVATQNARRETAAPQNARRETAAPQNARRETAAPQNARRDTDAPQNARSSFISQSANTSAGYQCPICLESARNNEMKCLPCYHAFHQACIDEWLTENRRCPVCRQETEPLQNVSRGTMPFQNARSSLSNQRQMIFGGLQSLHRMTNIRNNVGLNNGGLSMMLNNFFTRLTNCSMRLNNGGIEMMHNNGNGMILNNRGFEMRRNDGSSMILNNRGIEMRRNDGSSLILNTGRTRRNNINLQNS